MSTARMPFDRPAMVGAVVRFVKSCFHAVGLEIRRAHRSPPAALCDDALETLHRRNGHDFVVFKCPMAQLVEYNGMSFARGGWHPLVEAAREYLERGVSRYEGSCLERFYATFQPRNAREALIGAAGPAVLDTLPSYVRFLPWQPRTPEEAVSFMARIIEVENASFGAPHLGPADGYGLLGPVSPEKGRLEHARLISLVDSIRKRGYDRSAADVTIRVLRRGEELRYVLVHGHHRVSALAALGKEFVPALPRELHEARYIQHWSAVYRGIWSHAEALAYLNHLFDFDSLAWARRYGLAPAGEAQTSRVR